MVGLDNAGKTTILYKLQIGKVVTTIPTVGGSCFIIILIINSLYVVSVGLRIYFVLQVSMWRKLNIRMLILRFGMLEAKDYIN